MIRLEPFGESDFDTLIAWIDGKELLITIAGTVFTYPLTAEQLEIYLATRNSYSFNIVDTSCHKTIGHAEILHSNNGTCKIDKLLIGDKSNRGKGMGHAVIKELLRYSFETMDANIVELNVYDWNIAGIKCYENSGFTINPGQTQSTQVDDKIWTALNMTITKDKWREQNGHLHAFEVKDNRI